MPRFPPLNAIVDDDAASRAGWTSLDLARACLDGGATFLQFRAKRRSSAWLLDTADALVTLAQPYGADIIVNDRADVARAANAAGVHVGQDDLRPDAIRPLLGSTAIVGLSTHSVAQIDEAIRQPIDYVAIGPVFGTTTKDTGYASVGLALVQAAAARAGSCGVDVVAIGGITLDRAPDVLRAGATSVAIISDLLTTGDPRTRVRAYLEKLTEIDRV